MTAGLAAVSMVVRKDAVIENFCAAVSVAGCKGATIMICCTAVSVASCKGAAFTILLTAVSVAACKLQDLGRPWRARAGASGDGVWLGLAPIHSAGT